MGFLDRIINNKSFKPLKDIYDQGSKIVSETSKTLKETGQNYFNNNIIHGAKSEVDKMAGDNLENGGGSTSGAPSSNGGSNGSSTGNNASGSSGSGGLNGTNGQKTDTTSNSEQKKSIPMMPHRFVSKQKLLRRFFQPVDDENPVTSAQFEAGWDDPTHLTFRIEFGEWGAATEKDNTTLASRQKASTLFNAYYMDYDQMPMGLMDLNFLSKSNLENINNNETYNSVNWLYSRNEDTRAEYLKAFVEGIYSIQRDFPFIFQKISGIDKLFELDSKRGVRLKDATIQLTCIADGLDQKMRTLFELYRKAAWDETYQRWVLPDIMRYFKMIIYIFDIKNIQSTENNMGKFDKNANDKKPIFAIECAPCEFLIKNIINAEFTKNYFEIAENVVTIDISVKNIKTYFKNELYEPIKQICDFTSMQEATNPDTLSYKYNWMKDMYMKPDEYGDMLSIEHIFAGKDDAKNHFQESSQKEIYKDNLQTDTSYWHRYYPGTDNYESYLNSIPNYDIYDHWKVIDNFNYDKYVSRQAMYNYITNRLAEMIRLISYDGPWITSKKDNQYYDNYYVRQAMPKLLDVVRVDGFEGHKELESIIIKSNKPKNQQFTELDIKDYNVDIKNVKLIDSSHPDMQFQELKETEEIVDLPFVQMLPEPEKITQDLIHLIMNIEHIQSDFLELKLDTKFPEQEFLQLIDNLDIPTKEFIKMNLDTDLPKIEFIKEILDYNVVIQDFINLITDTELPKQYFRKLINNTDLPEIALQQMILAAETVQQDFLELEQVLETPTQEFQQLIESNLQKMKIHTIELIDTVVKCGLVDVQIIDNNDVEKEVEFVEPIMSTPRDEYKINEMELKNNYDNSYKEKALDAKIALTDYTTKLETNNSQEMIKPIMETKHSYDQELIAPLFDENDTNIEIKDITIKDTVVKHEPLGSQLFTETNNKDDKQIKNTEAFNELQNTNKHEVDLKDVDVYANSYTPNIKLNNVKLQDAKEIKHNDNFNTLIISETQTHPAEFVNVEQTVKHVSSEENFVEVDMSTENYKSTNNMSDNVITTDDKPPYNEELVGINEDESYHKNDTKYINPKYALHNTEKTVKELENYKIFEGSYEKSQSAPVFTTLEITTKQPYSEEFTHLKETSQTVSKELTNPFNDSNFENYENDKEKTIKKTLNDVVYDDNKKQSIESIIFAEPEKDKQSKLDKIIFEDNQHNYNLSTKPIYKQNVDKNNDEKYIESPLQNNYKKSDDYEEKRIEKNLKYSPDETNQEYKMKDVKLQDAPKNNIQIKDTSLIGTETHNQNTTLLSIEQQKESNNEIPTLNQIIPNDDKKSNDKDDITLELNDTKKSNYEIGDVKLEGKDPVKPTTLKSLLIDDPVLIHKIENLISLDLDSLKTAKFEQIIKLGEALDKVRGEIIEKIKNKTVNIVKNDTYEREIKRMAMPHVGADVPRTSNFGAGYIKPVNTETYDRAESAYQRYNEKSKKEREKREKERGGYN